MPAKSKSQKIAAAIALAVKHGKLPKSKLKGASKQMIKMKDKDLEKFVKTKDKNLPYKVKSEQMLEAVDIKTIDKIIKTLVSNWNRQVKIFFLKKMKLSDAEIDYIEKLYRNIYKDTAESFTPSLETRDISSNFGNISVYFTSRYGAFIDKLKVNLKDALTKNIYNINNIKESISKGELRKIIRKIIKSDLIKNNK